MNMKNTYKHIAAALAFVAAVSCAKQEINVPQDGNANGTYQYLLNVSQEDGSKTIMDGTTILWDAADQIAVMGKNGGDLKSASHSGAQSIADAETYVSSTQATFALNLPEGFTPMVATYPFHSQNSLEYINLDKNAENSTEDSLTCRFYIHSQQTAVKDGFPLEGFPMVGRIADGKCSMHNAGALIKFEIVNPDIVSIRFEGNNKEYISGRSYYYVDSGIFARTTGSSEQTVTLVPSGDVFEPGVYYFAVAPQNLTKGFKITVTNRFGQEAMKKSNTPFNIERNHKYTNFGSDEGWFKEVYTGSAGDLGSADGTTATIYGIVTPSEILDGDKFGFQTSTDGTKWTKYEGEVTLQKNIMNENTTVNVFTASLTGLTPGAEVFYRAYYNKASGITVYGKTSSFKTYSGAESVKINLYHGWQSWPFTNLEFGNDLKKGTSSAAQHIGEELTLTVADSNSFIAMAASGIWLNTNNGCLTMKVNKGDYIKIPVLDGKKPVGVVISLGNIQTVSDLSKDNNVQGLPSIHKVTDSGSGVAGGGEMWDPRPAYKYDSHIWNLVNTDNGEYKIYFNANNVNCYIAYLEVIYSDYSGPVQQETIINKIEFSTVEGVAKDWPFIQAKTAASNYVNITDYPGFIGPLSVAGYEEFEYKFYVSSFPLTSALSGSTDKRNDYWRVTGGQGLRFGGAVGDYMEICAVKDYKLTQLEIRGGTKTVLYSICDKNGEIIKGGEEQKISSTGNSTLKFELQGTTANTSYRLKLGSTEPSAIREISFTYELVK